MPPDSDIIALAVQGCRVMDGEEDIQDVLEVYLGWIKCDLDNLGVTTHAGADQLITRIWHLSSRIARFYFFDAPHIEIHGFEAPETAAGECCSFLGH